MVRISVVWKHAFGKKTWTQHARMFRLVFIRLSGFEEHLEHDEHVYIDKSLVDHIRVIWSSRMLIIYAV